MTVNSGGSFIWPWWSVFLSILHLFLTTLVHLSFSVEPTQLNPTSGTFLHCFFLGCWLLLEKLVHHISLGHYSPRSPRLPGNACRCPQILPCLAAIRISAWLSLFSQLFFKALFPCLSSLIENLSFPLIKLNKTEASGNSLKVLPGNHSAYLLLLFSIHLSHAGERCAPATVDLPLVLRCPPQAPLEPASLHCSLALTSSVSSLPTLLIST